MVLVSSSLRNQLFPTYRIDKSYAVKFNVKFKPLAKFIPANLVLGKLIEIELQSKRTSLYSFTRTLITSKELHAILHEDHFYIHPDVLLAYIKKHFSRKLERQMRRTTNALEGGLGKSSRLVH